MVNPIWNLNKHDPVSLYVHVGLSEMILGQLLRNAKSRMDACPVIWAFETGTEQSQQKFLSWDLTLVLVTSLFTLSLIQLLCCYSS